MIVGLLLSAALQAQTVQTCGQELGKWVCRTTQEGAAAPSQGFNQGLANGAALGSAMRRDREAGGESREDRLVRMCGSRSFWNWCTGAEESEARALIEAREARQSLRRAVTDKLASGDCPGAIRAALEGGDMDLAREARDFCRP